MKDNKIPRFDYEMIFDEFENSFEFKKIEVQINFIQDIIYSDNIESRLSEIPSKKAFKDLRDILKLAEQEIINLSVRLDQKQKQINDYIDDLKENESRYFNYIHYAKPNSEFRENTYNYLEEINKTQADKNWIKQRFDRLESGQKDIKEITQQNQELLKKLPDSAEIQAVINDVLSRQLEGTYQDIIHFLTIAFEANDQLRIEQLEEMREDFQNLKKSNELWEAKLKLAVPLLDLIGPQIEIKFDLKKFMKNIKQKTEELAIKYNINF